MHKCIIVLDACTRLIVALLPGVGADVFRFSSLWQPDEQRAPLRDATTIDYFQERYFVPESRVRCLNNTLLESQLLTDRDNQILISLGHIDIHDRDIFSWVQFLLPPLTLYQSRLRSGWFSNIHDSSFSYDSYKQVATEWVHTFDAHLNSAYDHWNEVRHVLKGDIFFHEVYWNSLEYLAICPRTVLFSVHVFLASEIAQFGRSSHSSGRSLTSVYKVLLFYHVLKSWLADIHEGDTDGASSAQNIEYHTAGWPFDIVAVQQQKMFSSLYRRLIMRRDWCNCIVEYDNHLSIMQIFNMIGEQLGLNAADTSNVDGISSLMSNRSLMRHVAAGATFCRTDIFMDWLFAWQTRSAGGTCLPTDVLYVVVCASHWLLQPQPQPAFTHVLNALGYLARLVSVGGSCLVQDKWTLSSDDVFYNYGRLARMLSFELLTKSVSNEQASKYLKGNPQQVDLHSHLQFCGRVCIVESRESLHFRASPKQHQMQHLHQFEMSVNDQISCINYLGRTVISNGTIFTEGGRTVRACSEMVRDAIVFQKIDVPFLREVQNEIDLDATRVGTALTAVFGGAKKNGNVLRLNHPPSGQHFAVRFQNNIFHLDRNHYLFQQIQPVVHSHLYAEVVDNSWCEGVTQQRPVLWVIPSCILFNVWHDVHWVLPALVMRSEMFGNEQSIHVAIWYNNNLNTDVFSEYDFDHAPGHFLWKSSDYHTFRQHKMASSWFSILGVDDIFELEQIQVPRRCYNRAVFGRLDMRVDRHTSSERSDVLSVSDSDAVRRRFVAHPLYIESFGLMSWRTSKPSTGTTGKRLVIVQRSFEDGRRFVGIGDLVAAIQQVDTSVDVRVLNLGDYSLIAQAGWIGESDISLGAHGAGLSWVVFARPGSVLIELVPGDVLNMFYFCPERWGGNSIGIYGGFSRFRKQTYICLKMVTRNIWAVAEGSQWRDFPFVVDVPKVVKYIRQALTDNFF